MYKENVPSFTNNFLLPQIRLGHFLLLIWNRNCVDRIGITTGNPFNLNQKSCEDLIGTQSYTEKKQNVQDLVYYWLNLITWVTDLTNLTLMTPSTATLQVWAQNSVMTLSFAFHIGCVGMLRVKNMLNRHILKYSIDGEFSHVLFWSCES